MPEVMIAGTILSASGFDVPSLYVRFRIVPGPQWTLLEGEGTGHSQTAEREIVRLVLRVMVLD